MKSLVTRYATPLTTGLFAISTISGVALFFHWAPGTFHAMHEWLSMALLVPFVLHVWKNWAPLANYARRGTLTMPLVVSLVAAVAFGAGGLTAGRGGNPAFRTVPLMTDAPLSALAPVLKSTPDRLRSLLEQKGYSVASVDVTLGEVAAASGKAAPEVLFSVMPNR